MEILQVAVVLIGVESNKRKGNGWWQKSERSEKNSGIGAMMGFSGVQWWASAIRLQRAGARSWNVFNAGLLASPWPSRKDTYLRFYNRKESGSDLGFRNDHAGSWQPDGPQILALSCPWHSCFTILENSEQMVVSSQELLIPFNASDQGKHILRIQIYFVHTFTLEITVKQMLLISIGPIDEPFISPPLWKHIAFVRSQRKGMGACMYQITIV